MLIRNLDIKQGLCNGTRMQIEKMTDDNLYCRITSGPRANTNKLFAIPKIKFVYGDREYHRGLRFQRTQFPIRLCFAMTINKVINFIFLFLCNNLSHKAKLFQKWVYV